MELIKQIRSLFFIRNDVYGVYSAYSPDKKAKASTSKHPVTLQVIADHLSGTRIIGAHSTALDETGLWTVFDLDGSKEAKSAFLRGDFHALIEEKRVLLSEARQIESTLEQYGFHSILEDSVGGFHLWTFFEEPIPSKKAYTLAHNVRKEIKCERFPKQASAKAFGNWVRLPGRYHSSADYSKIQDNNSTWYELRTKKDWEKLNSQIQRVPISVVDSALAAILTPPPSPILTQYQDDRKYPVYTTSSEKGAGFYQAVFEVLLCTPGILNDYDTWLKFCFGCKSDGLPYDGDVDAVCRGAANYDYEKNRQIYDGLSPDAITFASVYYLAEQANAPLLREKLSEYCDYTPQNYSEKTEALEIQDERQELCRKIDIDQILVLLGESGREISCPSGEGTTTRNQAPNWPCTCGHAHDFLDFYAAAYGLSIKAAARKLSNSVRTIETILQENLPSSQDMPEKCAFPDFVDKLCLLPEKTILILKAGTGVGKSHLMLESALALILKGERILFITDTLQSMNFQAGKFHLMTKAKNIDISIGFLCKGENDVDADILFTTYGELGRKGETAGGFAQVHQAIEGRYCFLDEAQELYAQKMIVNYPLAQRCALREKGRGMDVFHHISTCPRHSKKGNCFSCVLTFKKGEGEHKSEFYGRVPIGQLSLHQEFPERPVEINKWRLFSPSNYVWAWGCTYVNQIGNGEKKIPEILVGDQTRNTQKDYVDSLLRTMTAPQIRVQLPSMLNSDGTASPVSWINNNEEMTSPLNPNGLLPEGTKTPCAPCWEPILYGIDMFPLLQFFKSELTYHSALKEKLTGNGLVKKTFDGAEAIILASATQPEGLTNTVQRITTAKGWSFKQMTIDEIPFRFNVSLLKTTQRINDNKLKQIAKNLGTGGEGHEPVKTFLLYKNKRYAKEGYSHINEARTAQKVAMLFDSGDYHRVGGMSTRDRAEWQVLCTYPRAAVTKGFDFPELQVIIIDCQALLPTIALEGLHPNMTQEAKDALLFRDLQNEVHQIVGRAFRSLLPRIPGETVNDPMKKVVIYHSLPNFAGHLGIEKKLVDPYEEISESWLSSRNDFVIESFLNSVYRCLAGEQPQDWNAIDRDRETKKAANQGLRALSHPQREGINRDELKEHRLEIKLQAKIKQAREMKGKGISFRDIETRLHIFRMTDKEQEEFRQAIQEPSIEGYEDF